MDYFIAMSLEILTLIKYAAGAVTSICMAGVSAILFTIMLTAWRDK